MNHTIDSPATILTRALGALFHAARIQLSWLSPFKYPALLLGLFLGTGCLATDHALQMSKPHVHLVAHHVERLEGVFENTNGHLIVRSIGRLAGEAKPTSFTITLPLVNQGQTDVQRVILPSGVVHAGWQAVAGWRPVPMGSPLVFSDSTTYEWDRLRPASGLGTELRLVRRRGPVERWELLCLKADASTGECQFTVFEVRPQPVMVRHRAALAFLPLAMVSDVVAVGTLLGASTVGSFSHDNLVSVPLDDWKLVPR